MQYNTDTVPGESGSPVYVKTSSGDMIAIGVHKGVGVSNQFNRGKRIDTDVIHFVYNNPYI